MHLNGDPEGPPTKIPGAHGPSGGASAGGGAIARAPEAGALWEGSHIQIALFDAALASLANQATNHLVAGRNPGRMGSNHPNVVPYGTLYAAQDGKHFVLAIGTDRQFTALARALGLEGLGKDPRFATNGARVQHRDALDEILHRAFGAENSATLERALAAAKVPFGPVNDLTEAFAHPRAQRTALTDVLANGQSLRAVSSLAFEGEIPRQNPSAPPALGAHTDEVLRTTLGYSKAIWRCYGPKACWRFTEYGDITPVSATLAAGGGAQAPHSVDAHRGSALGRKMSFAQSAANGARAPLATTAGPLTNSHGQKAGEHYETAPRRTAAPWPPGAPGPLRPEHGA